MKGSLSNIASVDIGTYTARVLVLQWNEATGLLKPLVRNRAYIRLAKDFESGEPKVIKEDAIARTLQALDGFLHSTKEHHVRESLCVATGVVREARNQVRFINTIERRTGLKVRVLSGEEEASLTGLGILHGLHIGNQVVTLFDLGGGSTEFLSQDMEGKRVASLPLGSAIYTGRYLRSDPPAEKEVKTLESAVSAILLNAFSQSVRRHEERLLVGTGGTVTALASMIHAITPEEITPERMNGLVLSLEDLEALFSRMKKLTALQREELLGLDQGRAEVIVAGCLIVLCIMRFFGAIKLMVSVSDLLEGILIDYVSNMQPLNALLLKREA